MMNLSFQSHWGGHWALPVAVGVVSLFLALWFYRHSTPLLGVHRRNLALFCRAAALFLLFMALLAGRFSSLTYQQEKPRAAVLVDRSGSMAASHKDQRRIDAVLDGFTTPEFATFSKQTTLIPYGFSDSLQCIALLDTALLRGRATDMAATLRGLNQRHDSDDLDAVLIFTDGRFNRGGDARSEAVERGVPLWFVAVGDTAQPPDVMVSDVAVPAEAWLHQPVDVRVRVRGVGGDRGQRRLLLKQGAEILKDTVLQVPGGGFEREIDFTVKPQKTGLNHWTLSLETGENERFTANNVRQMVIRVREAKLRILLLAGAPSADMAAFLRQVEFENRYTMIVRIEKTAQRFYEGQLPGAAAWDSLSGALLWDYPTAASATWPEVGARLARGDLPFAVVAGPRLHCSSLNLLGEQWPWKAMKRQFDPAVKPRLSSSGLIHPVFRSASTLQDFFQQALPPLRLHWALHDTSALLMGEDSLALLTLSERASSRRWLLLGQDYFRWTLHAARAHGHGLRLWSELLDWLTEAHAGRGVLTTDRQQYLSGDPVQFKVRLDDATGRPMERQLPVLQLDGPNGISHHAMHAVSSGIYQGRVQGLQHGVHAATVTGVGALPMDTLRLWVAPFHVELQDQRANPKELARLALLTGGRSVPLDSLDALLHDVRLPSRGVYKHSVFDLRQSVWTLVLMALFLGLEWWLRRRSGLL